MQPTANPIDDTRLKQFARIAIGFAIWVVGAGSVLHAVLLIARDGHGCTYRPHSWIAAMGLTLALGVIAFPITLFLVRLAVRSAGRVGFGDLALKVSIATLPLAIDGAITASLAATGTIDSANALALASFMLFPVYYAVLRSATGADMRLPALWKSLATPFGLWFVAVITFGVVFSLALLGHADWIYDAGRRTPWLVAGALYAVAVAAVISGRFPRSVRPATVDFGLGIGASVLSNYPKTCRVISWSSKLGNPNVASNKEAAHGQER